MNEPLIDKLKEFITHGEAKITIKDGRVVKISYWIGDKENIRTLEELKETK